MKTQLFGLKEIITILIVSLVISQTWAGIHSTLETGEIVDRVKVNISTQLVGDGDYSGLGLMGHLEIPYSDSSSWTIGIGRSNQVNVQFDGSWKWIPIPDYNNQPAIGTLLGVTYINSYSDSDSPSAMGLYAHPIVSKKIKANFGTFNTYAGPLLGLMFHESDTWYPIRLAMGSELILNSLKNLGFMLEGSININNSVNGIALGVGYLF